MNRKGTPKTCHWPWGDVGSSINDLNWPPAEPAALGPLPGWYAISMTEIHRHGGTYEYFTEFDPVDTIGYSVNIYYVTRDQANQLRRKLGLPDVPPALLENLLRTTN